MLLGIIFTIARNLFVNNNKAVIDGQACVQKMFGSMQKYLVDAATWKGVYSGGNLVFPDTFAINIKTTQQKITLSYNSGSVFSDELLGENPHCQSNQHYIALSGSNIWVHITKQWMSQFAQPWFSIMQNNNPSNKSSVTSPIYFCRKKSGGDECHLFHEFIFDKRTQQIEQNKCLTFIEQCEIWKNE